MEWLGELGVAGLGTNAGRDICLATGLGRSRLMKDVLFCIASQAGLGMRGWDGKAV